MKNRLNKNFGFLDKNSDLHYAPMCIVIDGKKHWTNIPKLYAAAGYFPVEHTEKPIKAGFSYSARFENNKNIIVQKWDETEDTAEQGGGTEEDG